MKRTTHKRTILNLKKRWLLLPVFLIGCATAIAQNYIPAKVGNPRITTHEISSGNVILGITNTGGGMINKFFIPGFGDIMGEQSDKYGRGGQTTIRSFGHSGKYNPTQAGFSDVAGTVCPVSREPGKLVVDRRPCVLWRADNQYDYVEWENLAPDKYPDGGDSGRNSDADGLNETNLPGKQAAEITSEFDYYGYYENYMGKEGVTIPCFKTYSEFIFEREPGHCLNQFNKNTSVYDRSYQQSDISRSSPNGVHPGTDKDMNYLTYKQTIRFDNALWPAGYRHYVNLNGNWVTEERGRLNMKKQVHLKSREQAFPLIILSISRDINSGMAVGLYQPNSEVVQQQTVGGNYTDDRRVECWMSDNFGNLAQGGMTKIGFSGRTRGMLNRTRTPGNAPEAFRGELYYLVGTPQQIYENAKKITGNFVAKANPVFGNTNFTTFPKNLSLVARNLANNQGQVPIAGRVSTSTDNYQSIEVDVLRNGAVTRTETRALSFSSGSASFNFNISIPAELANYNFRVYGKYGNQRFLLREAKSIVAGDVYIINGQSNAGAQRRDLSASAYASNFIRSYIRPKILVNGNQPSRPSGVPESSRVWSVAQGDLGSGQPGSVGQWGLMLGHDLVTTQKVPVAIFNGAISGAAISELQRPSNYKTFFDDGKNYSKLYFRVNDAGLTSKVRAIIFAQGEADSNLGNPDGIHGDRAKYVSFFNQLRNYWSQDYPSVEHIYLFQTKKNCATFDEVRVPPIQEAQRRIAAGNNKISIFPTIAAKLNWDNCHFDLAGYRRFADLLIPALKRDLYSVATSREVNSPIISDAYRTATRTLVLEFGSARLSGNSENGDFYLNVGTTKRVINPSSVSGNKVTFQLGFTPTSGTTISYIARNDAAKFNNNRRFITNSNNIELINFDQYPIDMTIRSGSTGTGDIIGEVGVAPRIPAGSTGNNNFHRIVLKNTYKNPVVIMGPMTFLGVQPGNIRVRNVQGNSFEYQIDEWDYLDGVHASEDISYMVIEAGIHTLQNGKKIVARNVTGVNHEWKAVNYGTSFSTRPIVLSQIVTRNGIQAANTRHKIITNTKFDLRLQEELKNDDVHANETVSYIAVEQGVNSGTNAFEFGNTGLNVTDNWWRINFKQSYKAGAAFLASIQTYRDTDPVDLRIQNQNINNIQIMCQEERSEKTDDTHSKETINYAVFNPGNIYKRSNNGITSNLEGEETLLKEVNSYTPTVYPNPASTVINVDLDVQYSEKPFELIVTDLMGNMILKKIKLSGENGIIHDEIGISNFDSGIYFVQIATSDGIFGTAKFLKK